MYYVKYLLSSICYLHILFGEVFVKILFCFNCFFKLFNFENSLYILDNKFRIINTVLKGKNKIAGLTQ